MPERLYMMGGPANISGAPAAVEFLSTVTAAVPDATWADILTALDAQGYDVGILASSFSTSTGDGAMSGMFGDLWSAAKDTVGWTGKRLTDLGNILSGAGAKSSTLADQVIGFLKALDLERKSGMVSFIGNYWLPISIGAAALFYFGIVRRK